MASTPPDIFNEVTAVIWAFIHVICGSVLEAYSEVCGWEAPWGHSTSITLEKLEQGNKW